jgi:tripartite-type tricarboxylate transporter receptor subunit TctC
MTMRACVRAAAIAAWAVFGVLGAEAYAQGYPSKPIRLVVPFAPGGASDVLARTVGAKLHERLGQPVVVENKPGAATTLASAEVAKAPADGYTLMLAPAPFIITHFLYPKLAYDTAKDFAGIALVASSPLVVTVHPSVQATTLAELLALARTSTVTYGSPGNGSVPHLATELLRARTGVPLTHVPYKGGGPAVTDLVAGHIQMMMASPIEVSQHVAAGRLRYLAASTRARPASAPGVPTVQESGVADFDVTAWFGIVAPAGTPRDVVAKLSQEIGRILEEGGVREKLVAGGADITYLPSDAFDRFLAAEREKWSYVVRVSGAKID